MRLPKYVSQIIQRLEDGGYKAFAVGGCVRDFLLSRNCQDYDVATSATPSEVECVLFPIKIIKTGIAHGTVTAVTKGGTVEITTFRSEMGYNDFRHPDTVKFEKNIEHDLSRRDFTINAIAYNEKVGFVDLFGGMEDLKNKTIKAVGDSYERFCEDALRMLRALRFCAKLGFEIEQNTKDSIFKLYKNLSNISKERIYKELCAIVCEAHCDRVLTEFFEVFAFCFSLCPATQKEKQSFCASAKILPYLDKTPSVRFAALFNFLDNQKILEIFKSLKSDSKTKNDTLRLCAHLKENTVPTRYCIKKLLFSLSASEVYALFKIKALSNPYSFSQTDLETSQSLLADIIKNGECTSLNGLALTGDDLTALGLSGKEISKTLLELLDLVISDKLKNDRQALLNHIKNEQ